jgi:hypothetical protein
MSNPNPSKPSLVKGIELQLETLKSGLVSSVPTGTEFMMGKVSHPVAELVHEVDDLLAPFKDVREERKVLEEKLQAKAVAKVAAKKFIQAIRPAIVAYFGPESPELVSVGFSPRKKPAQPTAEQKLLRKVKAQKTRELRGTKGPRQNEKLKATSAPDITVSSDGRMTIHPSAESSSSNGGSSPAAPAR